MLYLGFNFSPCFQVIHLYSSWRQGMLVLIIQKCQMSTRLLLVQTSFFSPLSLPLSSKRGVSEQKGCSWFVPTVLTLPKVTLFDQFYNFGSCVTLEYSQTAPTPQTVSCMNAASENLHFHQVFFPLLFPMYWLFVHLAFIDSAAVAPIQFISLQRG